MYTILTTFPPGGSANVGDKLIEQAIKEIVRREKGETEFQVFFREESLDDHLSQINASRAVLMPGFPVRDTPMYPVTYRLTEDLSQIRVPLVPVGANWNVYPGDAESRRRINYSPETVKFLHYIASQVEHVACREYYTGQVLRKHGVENTVMIGDPAWIDFDSLGRPMRRPAAINNIVFSPPLSPYYAHQAEQIIEMLADLFPDATKYCAMHLADQDTADDRDAFQDVTSAAMTPAVTLKNRQIRASAADHGFELREVSGDLDLMRFYESCELHVGYECHAHAAFLRKRIPSVLIAEDARGVGFAYTLGVGGFHGFTRAQSDPAGSDRKEITSGYCTTLKEYSLAPARLDVHQEIRQFLDEELESGFRRYQRVGAYLDELYESAMRPFVQSIP